MLVVRYTCIFLDAVAFHLDRGRSSTRDTNTVILRASKRIHFILIDRVSISVDYGVCLTKKYTVSPSKPRLRHRCD